jgi:hypothetical protein
MKTMQMENVMLDTCVAEAQADRVIVTRNGTPVALIVGVEHLDQEQVELAGSDGFWRPIAERRNQGTLSRAEIERRLRDETSESPEA